METISARISTDHVRQQTEILFHKISLNYQKKSTENSAATSSLTETIQKLAKFLTVQPWEAATVGF